MDLEKLRVMGLLLAIVPMGAVIMIGIPTWAAIPTALVMLCGVAVAMWCQMVQDHTPTSRR